MRTEFDVYARRGRRRVRGWVQPEVFELTKVLDARQRSLGVRGGAAEIGVHHGQLLIGLDLLLRDDEKSAAIDLFEDQDLNVDKSGRGDRARFEANVSRFTEPGRVAVHSGDSTLVTAEQLRAMVDGDVRLFSVDGGHTENVVLSDMILAEETLSKGGIVIADDVFNFAWPEVVTGTLRYLERPDALRPFAIGYNKVFFAESEFCERYSAAIAEHYDKRTLYHFRRSTFGGSPVVLVADVSRTPREILARSPLATSIYRRLRS
ncbi:class I SAM-dependent methyltransferase [Williamsia deligens]|uniref:Class I SAM-dependent methyltransferase n=1 Tax=Williamsia deligens TaxID=321325 RepID=A0ABW3GBF4_9NOCA|nr:class I SAM-dependent methyltransferase [Williamsia deligens]MCP2195748.1 Methyltransferase domain-containing protein [Williamsia deligens]